MESPGKGQAQGETDFGELQRKNDHFFPFREEAGSSSRGWAGALGGFFANFTLPNLPAKHPGALPAMPSPWEG